MEFNNCPLMFIPIQFQVNWFHIQKNVFKLLIVMITPSRDAVDGAGVFL